jgi:hypothetical protein
MKVLQVFSYFHNPCSIATLTDCNFIFVVEGVLNEKCIFRGVLILQICIQLCLKSFF